MKTTLVMLSLFLTELAFAQRSTPILDTLTPRESMEFFKEKKNCAKAMEEDSTIDRLIHLGGRLHSIDMEAHPIERNEFNVAYVLNLRYELMDRYIQAVQVNCRLIDLNRFDLPPSCASQLGGGVTAESVLNTRGIACRHLRPKSCTRICTTWICYTLF